MKKYKLSGIILAGGKSRRFGTDKRLAESEGKILLATACEKLFKTIPEKGQSAISISAFEDVTSFKESVLGPALSQSTLQVNDLIVIPDSSPDSGPLGGILSGLTTLGSDWLLVLPVDLPDITMHTIGTLIDRVKSESPTTLMAVVAEDSSGRLQPLVGCYSKQIQPYIETAISQQELGVQRLLKSIELLPDAGLIVRLRLSDKELRNINFAGDV